MDVHEQLQRKSTDETKGGSRTHPGSTRIQEAGGEEGRAAMDGEGAAVRQESGERGLEKHV